MGTRGRTPDVISGDYKEKAPSSQARGCPRGVSPAQLDPALRVRTDRPGEPGPVVPRRPTFHQSLTERLSALRLRSPDASPARAPPSTQESESPRQGEEPEDKDPRDPEESEEPKEEEKQQQRRCKPKKPTRRDPSPESPSKRGPIPIRRH